MMPPKLSGSIEWDVGRGDDRKDTAGVFSGREVDQADLPGTACIAKHGTQGDPVRCDGAHLRADHSAPRIGPWKGYDGGYDAVRR